MRAQELNSIICIAACWHSFFFFFIAHASLITMTVLSIAQVMAHEAYLLANCSMRNHRAPPYRGSGDLQAYQCADGFVGTYEEVLLHSQETDIFKNQGEDVELPEWWVHLDHGASNRRKAAARMDSKDNNSLPVWWVHLDHGASNRRKASARMSSKDDNSLPVWWVHLDHGASNRRKAVTRMSAPRRHSVSSSSTTPGFTSANRATPSNATSPSSMQLPVFGRNALKRVAMFTAPDGFCGSLSEVVDHARVLGLSPVGSTEGINGSHNAGSSNVQSANARLLALEEQLARTERAFENLGLSPSLH